MANSETIDHVTLARLVEAGAVRGVEVVGQPGGWGVIVQYGMTQRALAARRGSVRLFRKFETLVSYLKGLGIAQYRVDAAHYDPTQLKASRARPDAAEQMRRAHAAAEHDRWFREQVEAAIKEADAHPERLIPHEEVKARWAKQRAELLARGR